MGKTVRVTKETKTGRNIQFQDTRNNQKMTLNDFVTRIESGNSKYSNDYYVRVQNGKKTPVSKPDGKKSNNLD